MEKKSRSLIRLALPKGRMQQGVIKLLADASIEVDAESRTYRPRVSLENFEAKILKPQNIIEMLHHGSRDIGFAGADWVAELKADLIELLDTGLDPVSLVAAAPSFVLEQGALPKRPLVVASEYERLTKKWISERALDAQFVHSYGATEVFPPEDADCIVDNTATGETLRANNLEIIDEIMTSSTRLYANPKAMDNPEKRTATERLVLLLRSALEARSRVMLELNVTADKLEEVVSILPCMREPTVAPLHGDIGYAVTVAVPRSTLPNLIFEIKEQGGSDIVITSVSQIVP